MYADYQRPLNREGRATKYREYDSAYVGDVTYPDNTPVATNQEFLKVWEIQNVGKKPWTGFYLENIDDPTSGSYLRPDSRRIDLPAVPPGQSIQIEMGFKAPKWAGTVRSTWRMYASDGELLFPEKDGIWCQVLVEDV